MHKHLEALLAATFLVATACGADGTRELAVEPVCDPQLDLAFGAWADSTAALDG